jgi:uncharacterized membrane protein
MTIKQRINRQRLRAVKRLAFEFVVLAAVGFAFALIFWEGLHRQLDLQDAQNQRWAQEAQQP